MSAREFGELINRLHLSSRQAANALGVGQRQIFYYLSGEHPVPGTVAILLRTKMALLQALQALHALDPDWPNQPIAGTRSAQLPAE
jgi:predicted transcriptional regulator